VCGSDAPKQRPNQTGQTANRNSEQNGVVPAARRFVGLDVHRSYASVAAVDSQQQVVLTARRIEFKDFDVWIR